MKDSAKLSGSGAGPSSAKTSIRTPGTNLAGTSGSSERAQELPKDGQTIVAIMKQMGITEYEPSVVNQLLEFMYKYVSDVLDDARVYSEFAGRGHHAVDSSDVSLAVQMQAGSKFVNPPPRDLLLDIAKEKNAMPLPPVKAGGTGLKLPSDRYCLLQPNYRLKTGKQILVAKPTFNTTLLGVPPVRPMYPGPRGHPYTDSKVGMSGDSLPMTGSPGGGRPTSSASMPSPAPSVPSRPASSNSQNQQGSVPAGRGLFRIVTSDLSSSQQGAGIKRKLPSDFDFDEYDVDDDN